VQWSGVTGTPRTTVTCLNLPTGATCAYDSNNKAVQITTSAGTPDGPYQIVIVFTMTQRTVAAVRHGRVLWAALAGSLGLPLGLLWIGWDGRKRRRWYVLVAGALLLMLLLPLAGCGGSNKSPVTTVTQVSVPLTLTVN
jgi:hypothetical protein